VTHWIKIHLTCGSAQKGECLPQEGNAGHEAGVHKVSNTFSENGGLGGRGERNKQNVPII